jgi:hypothetical protein
MELEEFLEHAGEMTVEELEHHGVKGMHWGVHRSVSTSDIHAARVRHAERVSKLDAHAVALSLEKTKAGKQKHLDAIHKLAKEARTSGDIEKAHRNTTAALVGAGLAGSLVATPGVGTAAGLAGAHIVRKASENSSKALVDKYEKSTLKDYH